MLKKLFFIIISFLLLSTVHAGTCPTIEELKANIFKGWQAFDIDNGELLSPNQLMVFKKNISTFKAANWLIHAPEGTGECRYHGKSNNSTEDIVEYTYLAKHILVPDKRSGNWHKIGYDYWECDTHVNECRFIE